jgi:hypothetical protein
LLHCVTLIEERAKLAALQRRQREGELVPASEVHALWQQLAAFIKANAMSLPSKATPQLALLTTASACEAYLRSLVTELLETLSRAAIVVDDDRTGDEGGADDGAGDEPRPTV